MAEEIRSKKQMYDAMRRGLFGNTWPTYMSLEEWEASGDTRAMGFRGMDSAYATVYNVPSVEVRERWKPGLVISPATPDDRIITAGEIMHLEGRMHLYFSRAKLNMKPALLAAGEHVVGLSAISILRTSLWPSSYEDLQVLIDQYPDHAIEYTAFDMAIGTLGDYDGLRNTIIWEVRRY